MIDKRIHRTKVELEDLDDRQLQEEILHELRHQNGLSRQDTHYLKRINAKIQILFWVFVAYVIFATVMFLTGQV